MKKSKWIDFQISRKIEGRKTDVYFVVTKNGEHTLGEVKWFPAWRKYAFFARSGTVLETQCLKDIVSFIDHLMDERKKKREGKQDISSPEAG